jgi:uncharacterized membrane protein YedE/YeeE
MKTVFSLGFGIVFGTGLAVSGMTNPAKVLAFLDVFGAWDPTLAVVMGSALAVSAAGSFVAGGRDHAWLGDALSIPTRRDIDASLVGGATLFGVGWGLIGLCPGPALANLLRGSVEIGIFVVAMVVGVAGYRLVMREPTAAFPAPTR